MPGDFDFNFGEAAKRTNTKLAEELSKHSTLTAEQIHTLLPRKADKKKLGKLIEIVNSSASQNKKIASLRANLTDVGGVLLKVLKTVV